jgi:hypothetical protein
VFELHGGRYQEVAHARGGERFTASQPFPVEVVPAQLIAGLLPG